jgi:hypothetical protein
MTSVRDAAEGDGFRAAVLALTRRRGEIYRDAGEAWRFAESLKSVSEDTAQEYEGARSLNSSRTATTHSVEPPREGSPSWRSPGGTAASSTSPGVRYQSSPLGRGSASDQQGVRRPCSTVRMSRHQRGGGNLSMPFYKG